MVEPTILGKRQRKDAEKSRDKQEILSADARKDDSPYEVRNSLRFVKPYTHEFKTFAKKRWIGEKLLDIFNREFKAFNAEYYTSAIELGKITVNGKTVSQDYLIREHDKIVHSTVRHETPVLAVIPEVVFQNDEFIAFNKPSSMPVHACGNFM